jgi:hypothetical protein
MQTTKIFLMAALALMTIACSNDDNDIQTPAEQPAKAVGIPFTATISMGESASTRALTENGTTIEATWATGEKVALIYKVDATTYLKEATVTPQTDGTATISTTLEGSPVDDTDVTIVYPASAVDESTKDVKTNLLASQNGLLTGTGSISENYELRKTITPAKLKIDGTTASLKGTVSLTNLNAIFKFTLQDLSAAAKSATEFKVSDNSGNVITTVTLGSASDVLYVALPAMGDGTYWFNATIDSKPYIAKATMAAATVAGKYYQTTVKMATIGDVILSDGTFAVKGTATEQAVLANIGYLPGYFDRFIAIALTDVGKIVWSSVASNVATYAADHAITIGETTYNTNAIGDNCYDKTRGTSYVTTTAPTRLVKGWRVPSDTDWRYVFYGISSITSSSGTRTRTWLPISMPVEDPHGTFEPSAYRTAINAACGNDVLQPEYYWSSSEYQLNNELQDVYGFSDNNSHKGFNSYAKSYMYGARVRTVFAY